MSLVKVSLSSPEGDTIRGRGRCGEGELPVRITKLGAAWVNLGCAAFNISVTRP